MANCGVSRSTIVYYYEYNYSLDFNPNFTIIWYRAGVCVSGLYPPSGTAAIAWLYIPYTSVADLTMTTLNDRSLFTVNNVNLILLLLLGYS